MGSVGCCIRCFGLVRVVVSSLLLSPLVMVCNVIVPTRQTRRFLSCRLENAVVNRAMRAMQAHGFVCIVSDWRVIVGRFRGDGRRR